MKNWLEMPRYGDWSIADVLSYCKIFVCISVIELGRAPFEMFERAMTRFAFGED